MRRTLAALAVATILSACGNKAHQETQTTVTRDGTTTTTITRRDVGSGDAGAATSGLKIDSDKFKADIEVPGLTFGSDHMDMDGMRLYPGSKVKGLRVHAVDHPGDKSGEVTLTFDSPAAPMAVAQHMAGQARGAGFALTSNTSALVSGSKGDNGKTDRFSLSLNANGAETVGVLKMTDAK